MNSKSSEYDALADIPVVFAIDLKALSRPKTRKVAYSPTERVYYMLSIFQLSSSSPSRSLLMMTVWSVASLKNMKSVLERVPLPRSSQAV